MNDAFWPMGMDRLLSSRPLMFNPKGFMVAILDDDASTERARASLEDAGFPAQELRVYTSAQILENHELYLAAQSRTHRVVGALTDDQETVDLYFGYAREGRGALWIHAPEKPDASRAMRCLAEHQVLHYRYFSGERQDDIRVRESSR